MRLHHQWLWLTGLAYCFCSIATAQASSPDEPLTLLYTERKPFQYADEGGRPKGILVEVGTKIFDKSGLIYSQEVMPANRVIHLLKANLQPICAVGWYKNKEREGFAQFSNAVYSDRSLRGVFRAEAKVAPNLTAKALFEDERNRILLKLGFAYGPALDQLIARKNPKLVERAAVDPLYLLRMVGAGRADVVLLAQEEIDLYAEAETNFETAFKVVVFPDLPKQEQRYVMCSKRLAPETMSRINAAIAAVVKLK